MGDFNNVLRRLRDSRGLTQDGFASAIGLSRSAVGMYENGSRTPDYEVLEKIADFFNVDIDYLIGRTDKTTYLPETQSFEKERASRLICYAGMIDPSLLDRMLAAGGRLPKENLEGFVLAMEAAVKVCESVRKEKPKD